MNDDRDFQKDSDPTDTLDLARWRSGFNNVVDDAAHENSPYKNRPAYLDQPDTAPAPKTGHKKDWEARPAKTANAKNWSKLSR